MIANTVAAASAAYADFCMHVYVCVWVCTFVCFWHWASFCSSFASGEHFYISVLFSLPLAVFVWLLWRLDLPSSIIASSFAASLLIVDKICIWKWAYHYTLHVSRFSFHISICLTLSCTDMSVCPVPVSVPVRVRSDVRVLRIAYLALSTFIRMHEVTAHSLDMSLFVSNSESFTHARVTRLCKCGLKAWQLLALWWGFELVEFEMMMIKL